MIYKWTFYFTRFKHENIGESIGHFRDQVASHSNGDVGADQAVGATVNKLRSW